MEISDLVKSFGISRERQEKAVFSTIFIAGNRLQTVFDKGAGDVTLKQFMLLTMVRRAKEPLTLTQLGKLLGCSRQNIKKLAAALAQKGYVEIEQDPRDVRAAVVMPAEKLERYFEEEAGRHGKKLGMLFEEYSDGEVEQLFLLLTRLYGGIGRLEAECRRSVGAQCGETRRIGEKWDQ